MDQGRSQAGALLPPGAEEEARGQSPAAAGRRAGPRRGLPASIHRGRRSHPGPGGKTGKWHLLSPVGGGCPTAKCPPLPPGPPWTAGAGQRPEGLESRQASKPWAQSRHKGVREQFGEGHALVTLFDPKCACVCSLPSFPPTYGVSISVASKMSLVLFWLVGCSDVKNNPVRPVDPQSFRPSEGQGQGIKNKNKGTRSSNLCSAEISNRVTATGVRGHSQRGRSG